MKNDGLQNKLQDEIAQLIDQQKSLMLATLGADGVPYASYAPYAVSGERIFVLLSEIAIHAVNLQQNPNASILIIEDESQSRQLFARIRVNYRIEAKRVEYDSPEWHFGVGTLADRHGDRIDSLSQYDDFHLFELSPVQGRYIKGFGRAYTISGGSLTGRSLDHLRDGHRDRGAA